MIEIKRTDIRALCGKRDTFAEDIVFDIKDREKGHFTYDFLKALCDGSDLAKKEST